MFLIGCTTGSKTNIDYHVNTTHHHHYHSQQKETQTEKVAILKCSNGYLVPEVKKVEEIYW